MMFRQPRFPRKNLVQALIAATFSFGAAGALADNGDILLGQTMPYSGPASVLSAVGKVQTRYFKMINDRGGINGRKVNLISLDDGYSPPKSVEQTRKLVEDEGVVAIFSSVGTAQNAAVQKYLNGKKIPQLFVYAAADKFADPEANPYSIAGMTLFSIEASIYARLVSEMFPHARIAILYQNDDYGKEYLRAFKNEIAKRDSSALIVAAMSYETTSPSVDSQVVTLAATDANVFLNISTGKFTSQAIRRAGLIGWPAQQFLPIGSNFVSTILKPAGLEYAKGAISATFAKTVGDPEWANDPGYLEWLAFMKENYPEGDVSEQLNLSGYNLAVLMTKLIEACGKEVTSENLMKHARSLNNVTLPSLLPGVTVNISPSDYRLVKTMRPQRFDGSRWVPISGLVSAE
jgi:ABC-type branched-subunit amino acid transport system substrate-binding protein